MLLASLQGCSIQFISQDCSIRASEVQFSGQGMKLTERSFRDAAGILLALFGGTRKHVRDRNRVPVRGDIHVLVVGK